MKKVTKGALAATTAGALLLGGAGSLAYWTTTGTVDGGSINSGSLSLSAADCDPGAGAGSVWLLDSGDAFNPATDTIVPGDTLTQVCTFTITARGNHLTADLSAAGGTDANGNALETAITPAATFTVGGAPATTITSADDGATLEATVVLAFPLGVTGDNTTQHLPETLSNYVVTATQTHA